ncbi:hypothetical protein K435DRAFT_581509, partial [Dendrothele bispora CBS 962.96]
NKKDSRALAEECVCLVYTVDSTCKELTKDDQPLPLDLTNQLRLLCDTLQTIRDFAQKLATRSFFKRLITYIDDTGAIQSHRDKVKRALDTF